MFLEIAFVSVMAVSALVGYAIGLATEHEPKAKVAKTSEEDPRDGWSPEDGAGYVPTEERERPVIETMTAFKGDFKE